ncbi:hypothetical protein NHX12_028931 [Muraenolepis orangiensis]|uniref:Dynein regulatory complex protein 10 n=1 Tax=Muraenolepis orangiensis TaxID=630683 RepID=A0A9Q0EF38_9TELE|nr:hypothetical protein NHX12_028931 [Muraenolepis orangiensis]
MSAEVKNSPDPTLRPISEDAMEILEPSQNKLCSPEAQRFAGVMEDCVRQVEIVAMLPAVLRNLDHLSHSLDDELCLSLRGHGLLVERLDGLEDAQTSQAPAGGPSEERHSRADLERDLQASLRDVLRQLRARPATLGFVMAEAEAAGWELSEGTQCLIGGLRGLRGVLVERLLAAPAKERQQARYVQELSLRHAANLELLASLEEKKAAATRERDAKMLEKDAMISKLESSLQQQEKSSRDLVLRTQQDAEKQSLSDSKAWEAKLTRLQAEVDRLKVRLSSLVTENYETETAMRKKRRRVETEVENWIQKYDADVGEKQAELDEVGAAAEEEKQELRELEEVYGLLAEEFDQIMAERELKEEEQREELRQLGLKTDGAVVIQAWWRGHCVRRELMEPSNSKKKQQPKKGKGKKGK